MPPLAPDTAALAAEGPDVRDPFDPEYATVEDDKRLLDHCIKNHLRIPRELIERMHRRSKM